MSRSISAILISVALLAGAAQAQSSARQREQADSALMNYLERNGLYELLASHLENQLVLVDGRRKLEIARRLSRTYSALHESAATLEEQRRWEALGLNLLERVPEADSIEFRVSLAQTSFRRLEHMAEESLLRLDSAPDRDELVQSLVDLLETLETIATKSDRRVAPAPARIGANRGHQAHRSIARCAPAIPLAIELPRRVHGAVHRAGRP